MSLQLTRRTVQIGKLNLRPELHGDESVPAIDIPLSCLMINGSTFDRVLMEEGAHAMFFIAVQVAEGETQFKAVFAGLLEPLKLAHKIEGVNAHLYMGSHVVSFSKAKLKDVTLDMMPEGGLTRMSATLQAQLELDGTVDALQEVVGKQIEIAIEVPEYNARLILAPPADEKQSDFVDGPLDKPQQKKRGRPRKGRPHAP